MARPQRLAKAPSLDAIGRRVRSVDDVSEYAKVLVYGDYKVGKTKFCATAPNVLIIDINEDGTRSAKGSGAHVLPVRTWPEFVQSYWWLRENRKQFESVALDTLTALIPMAMRFTLKEAEARDPDRPASMPDKRTWGKVTELIRPQLLAFRNLPLHVMFTAQERREIDEDTGELVAITPDMNAGTRGTAMGSVGVIGRLYKTKMKGRENRGKYERKMLVGDHDIIKAGDRTESLRRILRNPTMQDIIDAYKA